MPDSVRHVLYASVSTVVVFSLLHWIRELARHGDGMREPGVVSVKHGAGMRWYVGGRLMLSSILLGGIAVVVVVRAMRGLYDEPVLVLAALLVGTTVYFGWLLRQTLTFAVRASERGIAIGTLGVSALQPWENVASVAATSRIRFVLTWSNGGSIAVDDTMLGFRPFLRLVHENSEPNRISAEHRALLVDAMRVA